MFGDLSTGAADDLQGDRDRPRMVMRFGMDPALGNRTYAVERNRFLSEAGLERREFADETEREIDLAVRALVEDAFARATAILTENRTALEEGARLLMERETLSAEELPGILAHRAGKATNTSDGEAA